MPLLQYGDWRIDYSDDGAGEPVILIHSSVSGNRQWRRLIAELKDRYRVLAINLFGYGETTPWPGNRPQTLADQADLVRALCDMAGRPVHIAGHSFGGAVAMKAALSPDIRAASLILLEPNPFHLLAQQGRTAAYEEILSLRNHVARYGSKDDWIPVAERFADYWLGDGAWPAMADERQAAFLESLRPNFYEWDGVMNEETPPDAWQTVAAPTLVMRAAETRRPIVEITELLREACPHWRFAEVPEGGHMAPLLRPDLVNPIIAGFLDEAANKETGT